MKKLILFLSAFFFILFSLNSVSGFGPQTHLSILDKSLSEQNDTLIAQIILNNYDACLTGLEYPDVGIFEYFTNFKNYAGLHNYNTVDELLRLSKGDRDRAFAYCWKLHLGADGISHNYWVPAFIKKYKLNNYLAHAPIELSVENFYADNRGYRLMEGHAEFDKLVEQATGRDWSGEAARLNTLMGGGKFYSDAYTVQSMTTFGKIQKVFFWAVAKFVPKKTGVDYYNLAVDADKSILRGETPALDPSGELALKNATSDSAVWLYGITFLVIGVVFFISFKKRWIGFSRGR